MTVNRRQLGAFLGFTALLGGAGVAGIGFSTERHPKEHENTAASMPKAEVWTCPMHPQVRQSKEGRCPICGMDLVVLAADAAPASQALHVPDQVQRNSGIRVEPASVVDFEPTFSASGQIVADERRAVSLAPKVEGWIRRLGVSVVGQSVRRGQVLYEIYAPDLQLRQREYVEILNRRDQLTAQAGSMKNSVGGASPDMMLGSVARERFRMRSRLIAADMPESLIDELENSRRVKDVIPVIAQHDGVVTSIGAREGAFVTPAQTVLEYADLSSVWAEVQLTAEQLGRLTGKESVTMRSELDRQISVKAAISPAAAIIDPVTRLAKVRVPVTGERRAFPPGALIEVDVRFKPKRVLAIKQDCVLQSGRGAAVFVEASPGHFELREVVLGSSSNGMAEVIRGVEDGERVVVNGQFLLSSEATIQGVAAVKVPAKAGMSMQSAPAPDPHSHSHMGH